MLVLWIGTNIIGYFDIFERGGEKISQPVIHVTINDQVHAIRLGMIMHLMREIGVDVPAFAGPHRNAFAIDEEAHQRARCNGYVQPDLAVIEAKIVVAVFDDTCSCPELQKSRRPDLTFEARQYPA